jgi:ABC-2 type transport system permease protein
VKRLLLAESLKVLTIKLWWALLIPVAVIAAVIGFAGAAIASLPDVIQEVGRTAPTVAITMPLAMQQTTIFAMVLGVIGGAGEFRHKTITTSYLTAPSRGAVLVAKAIVYGGLGLLYGLATALLCMAGAMTSVDAGAFPSAGDTVIIAAVGTAGVIIWTVLGVGVGFLISSQAAVLIIMLIYMLFAEGLISLVLRIPQLNTEDVVPYLPGAASTALQTDHGIAAFAESLNEDAFMVEEALEALVGTQDQLSWWAGGLVFACYAALFLAGGWFFGRRRDIS